MNRPSFGIIALRLVSTFLIFFFIYWITSDSKPDPVEIQTQSVLIETLDNFTVVDVYDGDTFYINVEGWDPIVGERLGVRVNGVDTPEIRGTKGHTKELAYGAKHYTENALKNAKSIELRNVHRGKYFRIIADVYVDGELLSDQLIERGLGSVYEVD